MYRNHNFVNCQYAVPILLTLLCLLQLPAPTRAQGSADPQDPLAKALQQDTVYVGKTRRDKVDGAALKTIAQNASAELQPVKIAVLTQLPASGAQFHTRDAYTKALHDYLGMGKGTLLIMTQNGASLATDALPAQSITPILNQNADALKNDPASGIEQTFAGLEAAIKNGIAAPVTGNQSTPPNGDQTSSQNAPPSSNENSNDQNGNQNALNGRQPVANSDSDSPLGWVLGLGAIGGAAGLALWGGSRAAKKSRALAEAKVPVQRLYGEVVSGISYADTYLDLLPNTTAASEAKLARQSAAEHLDRAQFTVKSARTPEDYGRAEAVLEQAKAEAALCRSKIDIATGGTGFAVAVDGTDYRATPASNATFAAPVVSGLRAEDIPINERGVCFFCARPSRITDLTPITIVDKGQRRKVLACADDVRIVQQGATPQVRTVAYNGQNVPWYASRSYDPYRDYYGGGYGYVPVYGGYGSGMMDGFLLGALLMNPYPMAYPVFVDSSGYATNDFNASAPPVTNDGGWGGYSGDNSGGDWSNNQGGDQGSGDAGVGGVDWSGNTDTSGGDTSGSDFGGIDFGGGDSGGGSDFGGGGDFGGGDFGGGGDF